MPDNVKYYTDEENRVIRGTETEHLTREEKRDLPLSDDAHQSIVARANKYRELIALYKDKLNKLTSKPAQLFQIKGPGLEPVNLPKK